MNKIILIGGSPCSGKSTVSEYISKKYGYQYISVDDYMGKHIEESNEKEHPVMNKWNREPWHELFSRNVDVQLGEEIAFYEEESSLLYRDITSDICNDKVIIEGCALMPSIVSKIIDQPSIVYIIPEKEFQLEKYALRTWALDILSEASDPQQAFNNWMERDYLFGQYVMEQAKEKGYPVIKMDGSISVEEMAEIVLSLAENGRE